LGVNPRILLCDEIVSALDACSQMEILQLLSFLQKKYRLTILFISHDIQIIAHICNRIAYMDNGKISKILRPCEFNSNQQYGDRCCI
jgi:ABC-type dipeptide/oligopeptide/nickel transport system ATPase subunit